jgi:hypothetical protein
MSLRRQLRGVGIRMRRRRVAALRPPGSAWVEGRVQEERGLVTLAGSVHCNDEGEQQRPSGVGRWCAAFLRRACDLQSLGSHRHTTSPIKRAGESAHKTSGRPWADPTGSCGWRKSVQRLHIVPESPAFMRHARLLRISPEQEASSRVQRARHLCIAAPNYGHRKS